MPYSLMPLLEKVFWVILFAFLLSADFFFQTNFFENYFRNTIRVSNILDPEQAWHLVEHDFGPNCLQRLSTDNTRRQKVNIDKSLLFH